MKNKILTTLVICLSLTFCKAQNVNVVNEELLDSTPNFVKTGKLTLDTLFFKDIAILKQHIDFDALDAKILRKSILAELLYANANIEAPYTYRKLIMAINDFKATIGYIELRKGLETYEKMKNLVVDPKNWDEHQKLFERLGFTAADLDDFKTFISKPENKKLTYKEAYVAYIKEIDAISIRQ